MNWIDEKYGKPCKKCGLRPNPPKTAMNSEGGRTKKCECKNDIIKKNG